VNRQEDQAKRGPSWLINAAYISVSITLVGGVYYLGGRNEKLSALDAMNVPVKIEQINQNLADMRTDIAIIKSRLGLILPDRRASDTEEFPTYETPPTKSSQPAHRQEVPRRTVVFPEGFQ
jgi:hypothetical protein